MESDSGLWLFGLDRGLPSLSPDRFHFAFEDLVAAGGVNGIEVGPPETEVGDPSIGRAEDDSRAAR